MGISLILAGSSMRPERWATPLLGSSSIFRPARPWISYRATSFLDKKMTRDWPVIEFGSGMSTLWFARRCGFLHSIENGDHWYQLVSRRLHGTKHVRYELRPTIDQYGDVSEYADASVDLAFVDGDWRAPCVKKVVSKIRAGGYLYLDNTDLEGDRPGGDIHQAEALH